MTEKDKWNIAVCGTGFGVFYAEAIRRCKETFSLTGIVARGSHRSVRCAERYGVPLFYRVDELPEDTDAVCVVTRSSMLGGPGTDIALSLLRRGISVVMEQPVHPKDVKLCFQEALRNDCAYMTGNLYANLKEIRRFLQIAAYLRNVGCRLEYIRSGSSVQAFYPFVDIFDQLMPNEKVELVHVDEQRGAFRQAAGTVGDIPFVLQIGNEMNPKDPDNYMQLLHTFSCYYDTGRLELVDSRGPLLWYPRMDIPWSIFENGGIPETPESYPERVLRSEILLLTPDVQAFQQPYHVSLGRDWVDAIAIDLHRLQRWKDDKRNLMARAQREQKCSRLWNSLSKELGYAKLCEKLKGMPPVQGNLKQEAILLEERG